MIQPNPDLIELRKQIITTIHQQEAMNLMTLLSLTVKRPGRVIRCLKQLNRQGMIQLLRPIFPPEDVADRKQWYLENVYCRPVQPEDQNYLWQQSCYEQSPQTKTNHHPH